MKTLRIENFGNPMEVTSIVELDSIPVTSSQVRVHLELSPINPADLLGIQGMYPQKKKLPSTFGSEGIGQIVEIGSDVSHLKIGDRIILPLGFDCWKDEFVLESKSLFALPPGDPKQLAMISINPPTAYALINDIIELNPGDWIIQNAANSAVGRYVIQICKDRGIKTINIVRRESLVAELKEIGADIVIVDNELLHNQIPEITADKSIKLGLDAVSGNGTNLLCKFMGEKGTIVIYGAMSGKPMLIDLGMVMKKDLTIRSFWLVHWLRETNRDKIKTVYTELTKLVAFKKLSAVVDSIFPLTQYQDAFKLAISSGRNGKVLFSGPAYSD
ncbi:MAG: zinc-dependent alcohol dehydrogenase family protein [Candidatus Heimdallarchaeota archaeon]|nr:zinc-dependent alcohol dehydrogenase family protein [Candidatus Heimdallarchaeota archaeon]